MMSIRGNCLKLWNKLDPIYFRFTRLDYITNGSGDRTMIRVRLTKYKGKKITLVDGTTINKNDLLLKIHLHNVKLLEKMQTYDSQIRRALITYKSVQDSLPYLAQYIKEQGLTNRIKGLIGITTLHKASERLGFEVYPVKNRYYKTFKQFSIFPIHLLSCNKLERKMPVPLYLVMSKDVLFNKYSRQL